MDILKELAEKLKGCVLFLPAILATVIVTVGLVMYQEPKMDQFQPEMFTFKKNETEQEGIENIKPGTFDLEDGLYQGSGQGFKGLITVAVEMQNKVIENIWILSNEGDDEPFVERAKGVIESIIKEQKTDIDAVSGATYSSNGIIEAVKNALSGKQVVGSTVSEVKEEEQAESVSFGELRDGIYIGEAQGFGGTIQVQVTVKEGRLSDVEVLEASGEGSSYLNKATTILGKMVSSNSTNIDAVSGATLTSNGLIQAVRNALAKAEGKATTSEEEEEIKNENTTSIQTGTLPYKDGVYYGTGTGFRGDITVAIVIADKTLKAAIITESADDEAFLTRAKAILNQVVVQQNTDIDAVSGATYSSNGIMEALRNAFKAAKKGESYSGTTEAKPSPSVTTSATPGVSVSPEASDVPETSSPIPSPTPSVPVESGIMYKDGIYTGTAICKPGYNEAFNEYDLSLQVTVSGNRITAIKDLKGSGYQWDSSNSWFINTAAHGFSGKDGVVDQIIQKNDTTEIDAVSGATCSSIAIIEACKQALESAK